MHQKPPTEDPEALLPGVPFLFPEARVLAGHAKYHWINPHEPFFEDVDLLSGVIVNMEGRFIGLLDRLIQRKRPLKAAYVVLLTPACATRAKHLQGLMEVMANATDDIDIDIRVLHWDDEVTDNTRQDLPPTTLVGIQPTGKQVMLLGSYGDAGYGRSRAGSLNVVFEPDAVLLNAWRKWFQYAHSIALPLDATTADIPYLVPAEGDPEARAAWEAYKKRCEAKEDPKPEVDPVTGEVVRDAKGEEVKPWDDGRTKLDPLAEELQRVYAEGWLVTVDESTRLKPLAIPLKATLMGQQAEQSVGAVTQKQAFSLKVFDVKMDREVEKCRNIRDVVELLSYSLSTGNRWIPSAARALLEKEIEARNERGKELLTKAMGGLDVDGFIKHRIDTIRADVDGMYRQLGQGDRVPDGKFQEVLNVIRTRMNDALKRPIAPRPVYNGIGAPALNAAAPDENWNQPLGLMVRAAKALRKTQVDAYAKRAFHNLAFSIEEYLSACDPFKDNCVHQRDYRVLEAQLEFLDRVMMDGERPSKERCHAVWDMIRGHGISEEPVDAASN